MAVIQFVGVAANMYESDLGFPEFGNALVGFVSGRFTRGTVNAGQIQLSILAPDHGSFILRGHFNFSSDAAVLASTISSLSYENGFGASLTIGGIGQSIGGLVASLDTLGTTVSNDTITGGGFGDVLVGDRGNDRVLGGGGGDALFGDAGNDSLDGQFSGRDLLVGGTGNDTYTVGVAGVAAADQAQDVLVERSGEGTDQVLSYLSHTLGDNLERLTLLGSADLTGTGNGLNNALVGNSGANLLDGLAGADAMAGGGGNDTYVVDALGDKVTEAIAGVPGGVDLVQSSVSFTLGANIENLMLTGLADIDGTGNALANTLTGNDGNNRLDGGLGADAMDGGSGDDTYVVDNLNDSIIDAGGNDSVLTGRDVDLQTDFGGVIENLIVTGVGFVTAKGTDGDNQIIGSARGNQLFGRGGNDFIDGKGGADTMIGGAGDDTYVIDSLLDRITDTEGSNTLLSSVDVILTFQDFVGISEVILQGTADLTVLGSIRDDLITGNAGDNSLIGNDGNDSIAGGAGNDVLSGGRGNDTLDGGPGADTLSGGLGDDVYRNVDALDIVAETANGGYDTVESSTSVTLGETVVSIEAVVLLGTDNVSAIGSADGNLLQGNTGDNLLNGQDGNDTLLGDDGNDTLLGGDGNDSLDGGIGADSMAGGAGDDTYVWGNDAGDVVTELADAGTDTIKSAFSLALADFPNIENAELTGVASVDLTGTSGANTLTGNAGDNHLQGLDGNDSLSGGAGNDLLDGGTGDDTMDGGTGDDTFIVDDESDHVTDILGGTDLVMTSVDFTLTSGIEQILALGDHDLALTGTGENNLLTGNDGNNLLDGGGGFDTLVGGLGDDTYLLQPFGNTTIIENANQGTDTVRVLDGNTIVSLTGALANVENAEIDPSASTFNAITLIGNAAANRLVGGAGANVLDGGTGADTMIGGDGNDTYTIDDAGDEVVELANQGNDLLNLNRSVDLRTDFANIERFFLTGSADLTMIGNDADNVLVGNTGANRIDGGAGADTMSGGDGNDTYVVDSAGDSVDDSGNGVDLVESSITYTLAQDIENLLLTGTAAINGTGTRFANIITGNDGANQLFGGKGDDTLDGGEGNDTLDGGTGTDRILGGGGDDVLIYDLDDNVLVDGGTGNDLLRFTGSGATLDLNLPGAVGVNGRYQGIEALDLTGTGNNAVVNLSWQQIIDLSDDDRLIVDGNAGDTVTSLASQDWVQGADQTVGGVLYATWTGNSGAATLLIDTDVTFTPL